MYYLHTYTKYILAFFILVFLTMKTKMIAIKFSSKVEAVLVVYRAHTTGFSVCLCPSVSCLLITFESTDLLLTKFDSRKKSPSSNQFH